MRSECPDDAPAAGAASHFQSDTRCLLQAVYSKAFLTDYARRCKHGPTMPAIVKRGKGEQPVPRSWWRGAGACGQRALLRHLRGLGWGPRAQDSRRARRKRNFTAKGISYNIAFSLLCYEHNWYPNYINVFCMQINTQSDNSIITLSMNLSNSIAISP